MINPAGLVCFRYMLAGIAKSGGVFTIYDEAESPSRDPCLRNTMHRSCQMEGVLCR